MVELEVNRSFILKILGIYFILHSLRNLMQFFGIENLFTTVGHGFGVWYTDKLLSLLGLKYSTKLELWFFLFEFGLGWWLIKLAIRKYERE